MGVRQATVSRRLRSTPILAFPLKGEGTVKRFALGGDTEPSLCHRGDYLVEAT